MSFNDLLKKTEGIAQQVKGEVEVKTGNQVKGTADKIQGKAKEKMADIKMKTENKLNQ